MLSDWKNRILKGWNLMRLVRLGLAIFILVEAIKNSDILFTVAGGVVLFQAVLNMGCCGVTGCDITKTRKKASFRNVENTTFTEIK